MAVHDDMVTAGAGRNDIIPIPCEIARRHAYHLIVDDEQLACENWPTCSRLSGSRSRGHRPQRPGGRGSDPESSSRTWFFWTSICPAWTAWGWCASCANRHATCRISFSSRPTISTPWRLPAGGLDYLLKPVDKARLAETIERAKRAMQDRSRRPTPESAPAAALRSAPNCWSRNANRNFIVDAQDVIYATIDNGLITLVAAQCRRAVELPHHSRICRPTWTAILSGACTARTW